MSSVSQMKYCWVFTPLFFIEIQESASLFSSLRFFFFWIPVVVALMVLIVPRFSGSYNLFFLIFDTVLRNFPMALAITSITVTFMSRSREICMSSNKKEKWIKLSVFFTCCQLTRVQRTICNETKKQDKALVKYRFYREYNMLKSTLGNLSPSLICRNFFSF